MKLKYLKQHFASKKARLWWKKYLTESQIFLGMYRFIIFCLLLQVAFFFKPLVALLIIFTVATLSFLYAIIYAVRKVLDFVATEFFPNDSLTGYTIIGVGGFLFGLLILLPSFLALSKIVNQPIQLISYLITYFYAIPVWAFYLVVRAVKREEDKNNVEKST